MYESYFFFDKGAIAPASTPIDAHGPLLKITKYQVREQKYKKKKITFMDPTRLRHESTNGRTNT
jgi:hypothetical protein